MKIRMQTCSKWRFTVISCGRLSYKALRCMQGEVKTMVERHGKALQVSLTQLNGVLRL